MPLFRSPERPTASFTYRGRRIAYHEHGSGPRPIVLIPHARLVTANSMFEWRVRPDRLDRELLGFLDEVWQPQRAVA